MNQEQLDKAKTFASLHAGPEIFVIPNPWDIGTTQILTGMGFKALATTSAGYAFSRGCTDGIIGRDEMLAHARNLENGLHDERAANHGGKGRPEVGNRR